MIYLTHAHRNRPLSLPAGVVLIDIDQHHGSVVRWVEDPAHSYTGDALATNRSGFALCIRTADCLPVVIYDLDQEIIAVVHAGWKGIHEGIIAHAIYTLKEKGARTLHAYIGPHIRSCCYRIYGPRKEYFVHQFGASVIHHREGQEYLDLTACARSQLFGYEIHKIDIHPDCTACHPDRYDSYHRDGNCGSQLSTVVWVGPERVHSFAYTQLS